MSTLRNSPSRRVTINDVADRCGLSPTTVSHVLNGTKRFPKATEERVRRAAEALGYIPSASARSLRTQRSSTVGLLFHSVDNPVFAAYIHGIERRLSDAGYSVIVAQTLHSSELRQLETLVKRDVDGIIAYTEGFSAEELESVARTTPIVQIGSQVSRSLNCVRTDNFYGMEIAIKHLVEIGCRRIALVGGNLALQSGRERLEGFKQGLHLAGLEADSSLIRVGRYESWFGYEATVAMLDSGNRPDAIVAANNEVGMGVLHALHNRGVRIPDDIRFLVFSDVAYADFFNPPLTVVSERGRYVGRRAAELLLASILPKTRRDSVLPGGSGGDLREDSGTDLRGVSGADVRSEYGARLSSESGGAPARVRGYARGETSGALRGDLSRTFRGDAGGGLRGDSPVGPPFNAGADFDSELCDKIDSEVEEILIKPKLIVRASTVLGAMRDPASAMTERGE